MSTTSLNIKDMVSDNKTVSFVKCSNSELWYQTECGFEFPIPFGDIQGATFLAKDKALFFMRWIRPHINMLQSERTKVEIS